MLSTMAATGLTAAGDPLPAVQAEVQDGSAVRVEVLATDIYRFHLDHLNGGSADTSSHLRLLDAGGNLITDSAPLPGSGTTVYRWLQPGEYVLQVVPAGDADSGTAGSYELIVSGRYEGVRVIQQDAGSGAENQVVLRSDGGSTMSIGAMPAPASSPEATRSMAMSVQSLPVVVSQPIGRPRVALDDPSSLAWLERSGTTTLPVGFVLGKPAADAAIQLSVTTVSGSFLDSLTDGAPVGTYPLAPSTHLVSDLTEVLQNGTGVVAEQNIVAGDDTVRRFEIAAAQSADRDGTETAEASMPTSFGLGVVASLGAASALSEPTRERIRKWMDWAARRMARS